MSWLSRALDSVSEWVDNTAAGRVTMDIINPLYGSADITGLTANLLPENTVVHRVLDNTAAVQAYTAGFLDDVNTVGFASSVGAEQQRNITGRDLGSYNAAREFNSLGTRAILTYFGAGNAVKYTDYLYGLGYDAGENYTAENYGLIGKAGEVLDAPIVLEDGSVNYGKIIIIGLCLFIVIKIFGKKRKGKKR